MKQKQYFNTALAASAVLAGMILTKPIHADTNVNTTDNNTQNTQPSITIDQQTQDTDQQVQDEINQKSQELNNTQKDLSARQGQLNDLQNQLKNGQTNYNDQVQKIKNNVTNTNNNAIKQNSVTDDQINTANQAYNNFKNSTDNVKDLTDTYKQNVKNVEWAFDQQENQIDRQINEQRLIIANDSNGFQDPQPIDFSKLSDSTLDDIYQKYADARGLNNKNISDEFKKTVYGEAYNSVPTTQNTKQYSLEHDDPELESRGIVDWEHMPKNYTELPMAFNPGLIAGGYQKSNNKFDNDAIETLHYDGKAKQESLQKAFNSLTLTNEQKNIISYYLYNWINGYRQYMIKNHNQYVQENEKGDPNHKVDFNYPLKLYVSTSNNKYDTDYVQKLSEEINKAAGNHVLLTGTDDHSNAKIGIVGNNYNDAKGNPSKSAQLKNADQNKDAATKIAKNQAFTDITLSTPSPVNKPTNFTNLLVRLYNQLQSELYSSTRLSPEDSTIFIRHLLADDVTGINLNYSTDKMNNAVVRIEIIKNNDLGVITGNELNEDPFANNSYGLAATPTEADKKTGKNTSPLTDEDQQTFQKAIDAFNKNLTKNDPQHLVNGPLRYDAEHNVIYNLNDWHNINDNKYNPVFNDSFVQNIKTVHTANPVVTNAQKKIQELKEQRKKNEDDFNTKIDQLKKQYAEDFVKEKNKTKPTDDQIQQYLDQYQKDHGYIPTDGVQDRINYQIKHNVQKHYDENKLNSQIDQLKKDIVGDQAKIKQLDQEINDLKKQIKPVNAHETAVAHRYIDITDPKTGKSKTITQTVRLTRAGQRYYDQTNDKIVWDPNYQNVDFEAYTVPTIDGYKPNITRVEKKTVNKPEESHVKITYQAIDVINTIDFKNANGTTIDTQTIKGQPGQKITLDLPEGYTDSQGGTTMEYTIDTDNKDISVNLKPKVEPQPQPQPSGQGDKQNKGDENNNSDDHATNQNEQNNNKNENSSDVTNNQTNTTVNNQDLNTNPSENKWNDNVRTANNTTDYESNGQNLTTNPINNNGNHVQNLSDQTNDNDTHTKTTNPSDNTTDNTNFAQNDNQQSLPQTGSKSQIALIGLGLSMIPLGFAFVKKQA